MQLSRAIETKAGHVRPHSFYTRRERDAFVAEDPEHRRSVRVEEYNKYAGYKRIYPRRHTKTSSKCGGEQQ